MAVTEEDLEQKRKELAKLREQIASTGEKASTAVQEQSNAIQAAQLDAEKARLEAQLAAQREAAKVSTIRAGSTELNDTLKAARDAAAEVTPPGVTIDTNAENQPSNTTGATVAVEGGVTEVSPADGTVSVVAPDKKDGGSN